MKYMITNPPGWRDKYGFDVWGYDSDGFSAKGFDKYNYNRAGYDPQGRDVYGLNRQGLNFFGTTEPRVLQYKWWKGKWRTSRCVLKCQLDEKEICTGCGKHINNIFKPIIDVNGEWKQ